MEILTHAADAARVGLDGLGLQALELEMLEVGLVSPIELGLVRWGGNAHVASSRVVAKSPRHHGRGAREE